MARVLTVTLNPALDLSTETARVTPGPKLRCAPPRREPGGGGVNVSRAIRQLGGESVPLVAVAGATGAALIALMRGAGLAPVAIAAPGETRASLAVSDIENERQYRFVLPGERWTCADAERAAAAALAEARDGDIVALSGSQPEGVAVDFSVTLAAALRERGARLLVDTSGPALAAAARPGAGLHALRMDDAEAESLAGRTLATAADSADLAARLVATGAATVAALARGAEGTVIADAKGRWLYRPPRVAVVSAVGAGDSFLAAFAMALARGAGAAEACGDGVAAAAAAVTTPDSRLCDAQTYARLRPSVVIEAL